MKFFNSSFTEDLFDYGRLCLTIKILKEKAKQFTIERKDYERFIENEKSGALMETLSKMVKARSNQLEYSRDFKIDGSYLKTIDELKRHMSMLIGIRAYGDKLILIHHAILPKLQTVAPSARSRFHKNFIENINAISQFVTKELQKANIPTEKVRSVHPEKDHFLSV